ncbi:zinc-binding dehydrogenase [Pisciglobus halotolerans]|uniref:Zinc-binding alcohol dehydrogenase/oxidoreductase n=1 Tax=Pisciglobus halotolerans TaxID=745365 RepID=A0A1I3DQ45_9LACT|nr:zinc-binding dehydrogenase [Pisciglobus halotolerans]SFH88855.1 zinc-binding alcohol dehydrogenase/oxidoreductase [Pisciglobus halotolerans]
MKSLVHESKAGLEGLTIQEAKVLDIGENDVRMKIKYAGLNHRDLITIKNHGNSKENIHLGSDGAGVVTEVGHNVTAIQPGDEVIINAGLGWKENKETAPENFQILGGASIGTFAEEIVLPEENVVKKPEYLSWEEAGVISLSGLTAYRALFTKGKVKAGMKVLIPGIGGGVATFLLQFAKAAGAEVYVTSRSKEKLEAAKAMGADKTALSSEDWAEAFGEKADLVIESVGAATFNQSLDALKRGGTMVTFGSSTGDTVEFNLRKFFYGQYTLKGSTMGSQEEYKEMLSFAEKHQIHPIIDHVFAFNEYRKAFETMENAEQHGKIVLAIGK